MAKVYTSAEDCISRQAVLEYIEGSEAELGHSSENELVCQDIKEFPPVTPFRKINKTYKVFCIGGDPKKIAFLANELRKKIDDLQDSGWEIDGVDLINNTRAWASDKQMYVETPEYIIRAKKPEELHRLPNTFEGPDYSKEDSNEFKDLYLVKHYPNRARASIEVYALGDLGRIPKDSIWGNIKELRYLYEEYKVAMSRHRRYKNIGQGNNCNWFVTKADGIRQVLNLYWEELEKGEINA